MKKISIITPTYNEEDNIEDCYNSVKEFFNSYNNEFEYEHIFVDNSSTDSTMLKIKNLTEKDKRIKIIINQQNYGILPSIFNALNYCKSDYTLVCYAADMQDPIDFLHEAFRRINEGYEIVYAQRDKRQEGYFYKYTKKFYYNLAKKITDNVLKPNVNIFQLISDDVRKEVLKVNSNNPFIPYIIQSTSFKKIGVTTAWLYRKKNKAKNNLFDLINEATNAICNYSGLASKISFILSITLFIFSTSFFLFNFTFLILDNFSENLEIAKGIPSIIIFNCIMFSAIFVILGIISENINHLLQIKIGKKVTIKEKINFD
tara:strand:- start:462 stop:1409 length:948 start_codon:yes stop_codon:yes gene_type:complete